MEASKLSQSADWIIADRWTKQRRPKPSTKFWRQWRLAIRRINHRVIIAVARTEMGSVRSVREFLQVQKS